MGRWRNLSLSGIRDVWRKKAHHSIPLNGLTLIPRTPVQLEPGKSIRWLPDVQIAGEIKNGLLMPAGSSACYRLYIPARANFLSHIALMPETCEQNGHGVVVQLEVLDRDGKSRIKWTKLIDPKHFRRHRKWIKVKLGLRRVANLEAQIVLSTLCSRWEGAGTNLGRLGRPNRFVAYVLRQSRRTWQEQAQDPWILGNN